MPLRFTLRVPVRVVPALGDAAYATAAAAAADARALPSPALPPAHALQGAEPTPAVEAPPPARAVMSEQGIIGGGGGSGAAGSVETPPGAEQQSHDATTAALELKMLEELTKHASDVFICCTAEGGAHYLYTSPSVTRVLGWQPSQLLGRSAYEFLHPDGACCSGGCARALSYETNRRRHCSDAERMGKGLAAVLDGSAPCAHMMHRWLHMDGSYRWFHSQACRQARLVYEAC